MVRFLRQAVVLGVASAALSVAALPAGATTLDHWQNVGPYVTEASCEYGRGVAAGKGFPTRQCELHPINGQWWFLAYMP